MSKEASISQAVHTLTLISKKKPSQEHMKRLHDGPLSDLMDAIIAGTLPERNILRKAYGLPYIMTSSESEGDIDFIVHVDRSIRPTYPKWALKVMHPELENAGPDTYDIREVEQWLHVHQKGGFHVYGAEIYNDLKKSGDIKIHLGLRDLEEIQKKGTRFFRKCFGARKVYGWASVLEDEHNMLQSPYLCESEEKIVLGWRWLANTWNNTGPALRHPILSSP